MRKTVMIFMGDKFFLGIMLALLSMYLAADCAQAFKDERWLMVVVNAFLAADVQWHFWRKWRHQIRN